jgi:WD40 repeat protein
LYSDCDIPAQGDPGVERQPIVAFSHLGRDRYAIGNEDGTIGLVLNEYQRSVFQAHNGPISEVVFSPDSDHFASAGGDGKINIWQVSDTSKVLRTFKHNLPASSVAWSADGRFVVSGGHDRLVRVWDVPNNRMAYTPLKGHEKDIQAVAYHPTRKWIVSASQDGSVKVWDEKFPAAMLTLIAFADGRHIVYHRSGRYTGSADIAQNIIVSRMEADMAVPVDDMEKRNLYVPPDDFAKRFLTGTGS